MNFLNIKKNRQPEMPKINNDFNSYKAFLKNSVNLKNIALTDLKTLSKDVLTHTTVELYSPNDFYYNALHLKRYAGLNEDFQIKASMEHGAGYSNGFWSSDAQAPFRSIIVASQQREDLYKKAEIIKNFYKIGPTLYYAESILTDEEIQAEKKRLGKNALVFPAHSTRRINAEFNVKQFIEQLKFETKDFDNVRICLYWKNILNGEAEPYLKAGFECVSCGHIYDPWFLPRQRALIEIADVTISNAIGSQIPNSLALNTPHYLINTDLAYSTKSGDNEIKENMNFIDNMSGDNVIKEHYKLFSELKLEITNEQRTFGNYYYGLNELKSSEEIKNMLLEIENTYEEGLLAKVSTSKEKLNTLFDVKYVKYSDYSMVDEYGRVFTYNNKIYRGINEKYKYEALKFLSSDLYKELVKLKCFPKTTMADIKMDEFAFVVEHEKLQPSRPSEWSFSMIKDATIFLADLKKRCLKHGYYLKDGHFFNVLFKNNKPIFVEMGSIVEKNNDDQYFKDFKDSCLMPLVLYSMDENYLAHALLSSDFNLYDRLAPKTDFYNSFAVKQIFERFLLEKMKLNPIKAFTKKDKFEYVFRKLLKEGNIEKYIRSNFVSRDYEPNIEKLNQIALLIKNYCFGAKSFCCLGGGLGEACLHLEKSNLNLAELINIDYNEQKIENSYLKLKQSNLKIGTYLLNFILPKRKSAYKDFQSDIVYVPCVDSLLKQGYLPDFIFKRISMFSNKFIYLELSSENAELFKNKGELVVQDFFGEDNVLMIVKI